MGLYKSEHRWRHPWTLAIYSSPSKYCKYSELRGWPTLYLFPTPIRCSLCEQTDGWHQSQHVEKGFNRRYLPPIIWFNTQWCMHASVPPDRADISHGQLLPVNEAPSASLSFRLPEKQKLSWISNRWSLKVFIRNLDHDRSIISCVCISECSVCI